jgi:enoyl-CoA hydratase
MIDYEVQGRVAVITINRPEARNAVNGEVANGIEAAIDALEDDPEVWIAVLTGAGTVFSAGADLKAINEGRAGELMTQRGGFAGFVYRERRKPVIAAVDGLATAGGCEIVLACDLVVASSAAAFGLAEVKRNLIAGAGGLFRLPMAIGTNVAMEAVLTGEPLSAERAYQLGLVNRLVEPGAAREAAIALAAQIAENAPIAVWESRKIVRAAAWEDEATLKQMTDTGFSRVLSSADTSEGLSAFIEKRKPNWTGH